ncbi:4263_t:CDS:2, partial [Racocetra fulgida]
AGQVLKAFYKQVQPDRSPQYFRAYFPLSELTKPFSFQFTSAEEEKLLPNQRTKLGSGSSPVNSYGLLQIMNTPNTPIKEISNRELFQIIVHKLENSQIYFEGDGRQWFLLERKHKIKIGELEMEFKNFNGYEVLKEARTSALEVAKYLLSLDPHKKYFTLKIISLGEEGSSLPTEGNFRLNKLLHMSKIFHCMEYGKPLFRERMEAFEHGALVYNVYMNFLQLYHLPTLTTALDKETQDFVSLIFNYFYSYKNDNETLKNFSHEDPAFKLGDYIDDNKRPAKERRHVTLEIENDNLWLIKLTSQRKELSQIRIMPRITECLNKISYPVLKRKICISLLDLEKTKDELTFDTKIVNVDATKLKPTREIP